MQVETKYARSGDITLDAPPTNLPPPTTTLVGRAQEIDALRQLLHEPYARWITLTGPGGTGKTRLALATAEQVRAEYEHGVFFVALDALDDPALVLPTLAQTLGVQESSTQSLLHALRYALADKQMLLLLDNLEQVVEAANDLAELLSGTPRVQVLATSRELVRVYGEHNFPVTPLAVPDVSRELSLESLQQNEAVQLLF